VSQDNCEAAQRALTSQIAVTGFTQIIFRFLSYSPSSVNKWFGGRVECAYMEFLGDLMSIRNMFSWLVIAAASFTLSTRTFAQGEWAVEKTFHFGGEGGFDYITADPKSHRLYVPRR